MCACVCASIKLIDDSSLLEGSVTNYWLRAYVLNSLGIKLTKISQARSTQICCSYWRAVTL
ncbi:hypothetical protein BO82DRAFT_356435 [Aspergillus uvarum CBS 121591]|uniref:Uncharacterized protein n=1 Tax=Aspergillus uvarum CBS 121591 TaxID=1448315 RepID=A0A319C2X2_9EURO|nr:hypothetical protein BO82DRAFT_356435 [Aspergillus uvarum CBS 121591]PYH79464.1 hypothetical protein BO82DRAFT_356435 [Aspergillus uvarum CBS 121591]